MSNGVIGVYIFIENKVPAKIHNIVRVMQVNQVPERFSI